MEHMFSFVHFESAQAVLKYLKELLVEQGFVRLSDVCIITDTSYAWFDRDMGWFSLDDVTFQRTPPIIVLGRKPKNIFMVFPPIQKLFEEEET